MKKYTHIMTALLCFASSIQTSYDWNYPDNANASFGSDFDFFDYFGLDNHIDSSKETAYDNRSFDNGSFDNTSFDNESFDNKLIIDALDLAALLPHHEHPSDETFVSLYGKLPKYSFGPDEDEKEDLYTPSNNNDLSAYSFETPRDISEELDSDDLNMSMPNYDFETSDDDGPHITFGHIGETVSNKNRKTPSTK